MIKFYQNVLFWVIRRIFIPMFGLILLVYFWRETLKTIEEFRVEK